MPTLRDERRSIPAVVLIVSMASTSIAPPAAAGQGQPIDVSAMAERGDPDALFALAVMHELGSGFKKNPAEAARLYQRAADTGHLPSKVQLGLMYQTGTGVPRDLSKALAFFDAAAQGGDVEGQFRLAIASVYGVGVAKDPVTARRWLAAAANGGHQEAQLMLGIMMQAGTGGAKNEFSARRWLRQAASGRDAEIKRKAGDLAAKIEERILFSGAFRPAEAAVIAAISAGLLLMILGGDGGGARSGSDPTDPFNYSAFGSTQRKQRCFQAPLYGSQTLNGRLTFMSSPSTFTQCVSY